MNAQRQRILTVMFEASDASQATLAASLIEHAPGHCRVVPIAHAGDAAAVEPVRWGDTILFLDPDLFVLMGPGDAARAPASRMAVFLDGRFPLNDSRFESIYRRADCVVFEDEGLWRRMGCPAGTAVMPPCTGAHVPPGATDNQRGDHTVWLLPDADDFPYRYEPWLPAPDGALAGTEFEGKVRIPPASDGPTERAALFKQAAVAVCASETLQARRWAREAQACGCALVVTDLANETGWVKHGVAGVQVVPWREPLLLALREARDRREALVTAAQAELTQLGWAQRGAALFDALIPDEADDCQLDLSDQVTVFVTTVGAPGFEACMAHLARQDCRFRLEVIERVAPMSAAFQCMLDRCVTPYYVQVDEDMMLYRDAVRRLYACLSAAPGHAALAVAYLHDTFMGLPIQGVKIFRHDVVRRYPLADVRSCEMDQLERLRRDGYGTLTLTETGTPADLPPALGLHDVPRDARTVYERFRTLELARQQHHRRLRYLERWPALFVERYLRSGDPMDAFALLGMLAGRTQHNGGPGAEKDFRAYAHLPGFAEALDFIRRVNSTAPSE